MTSICTGDGPSEAKPGFAEVVAIGPAVITALLSRVPMPWAIGLAAYVAYYTLELSSFCTSDPPADPSITAADAIALLTLNPVAAPIAERRFRDLIGRYLWHDLCQCVSGAAPVPPTPPAEPTGWPDIQPNLPLPQVTPCETHTIGDLVVNANQNYSRGGMGVVGKNATLVRVTMTNTMVTSPGPSVTYTIEQYHVVGGAIVIDRTQDFALLPTMEYTTTLAVAVGVEVINVKIAANSAAGSTRTHAYLEAFCNGAVPGPQTPCCPPDPLLQGQITQILQLVTLMQRQLAPFAYITSTVHADLAGQGDFDIQGLLGVKVTFSAIPDSLGRVLSTPTEIFDLGFLTFGTPDGYPQSIRLEHSPQLVLPARCSAFTNLSYSLHPGVTATITELVREP